MANTFNHNDKVVINDSGQMSVNSTSFAYVDDKLYVSGGNIILDNNRSYLQYTTGGSRASIISLNSSNNLNVGQSNVNNGSLNLYGGTGNVTINAGASEIARFTTSGNVGIGTTSPSDNLEVSKEVSGALGATLGVYNPGYNANSSSSIKLGRTSDSNWEIKSLSNTDGGRDYDLIFSERDKDDTTYQEYLRITSAGNVGIGTTSPSQKLDVVGNIELGGGGNKWILTDEINTGTGRLGIQAGAGSAAYGGSIFLYAHSHASHPGDVVAGISSGSNGAFRVNTHGVDTGTDLFYVGGSSGNVGIGTTSPSDRLHVEGTHATNTNYIYLSAGSSNSARFTKSDNIGTVGGALYLQAMNANNVLIATGGGNVGVGTTSPSSKFEVSTAGFDGITLSRTAQNAGSVIYSRSYDTSNVLRYSNRILFGATAGVGSANGFITFETANANTLSERLRITSDGNVGIGTTSPSAKLHVYNGEAIIATSTDGIKLSYSVGNSSGIIDTAFSDNNLEFRTNGSTKMWIANGGNVGIGTTNPAYKLDVNGDIRATQLLINESFKSAYNSYTQGAMGQFVIQSGLGGLGEGGSADHLLFRAPDLYEAATTSGGAYSDVTSTYSATYKNLFMGLKDNVSITNQSVYSIRMTWDNIGYKWFDTLYMPCNLQGNSIDIIIEKYNGTTWTIVATRNGFTGWEGRNVYINSWNNSSHSDKLRITFNINWNNSNAANIYRIAYYGGYPAGAENKLFTWDYNKNINIYGDLKMNGGTFLSDDGVSHYVMSQSNLYLYSGSNPTITLSNGGNVGIGTTSPAYTLDVNGSAGIYGDLNFTKADGVGINAKESLIITIDSDNNDTGRVFQIKEGSGNTLMLIQEAGNVGIGTTSPVSKLDVAGELSADYTFYLAADGSANYTASRIRLFSHNNYRGSGTFFTGVDSTWFIGTPYTDFSGGFIIARKSAATSYEDTAQYSNALFTVKSTGNVGIGTTSPSYLLDVNGSGRIGSGIGTGVYVGNTSHAVWTRAGGTNGNMALYSGGSDRITIVGDSGNVGIGTTSPAVTLEANGKVRSTRSGVASQYLEIDGGTAGAVYLTASGASKPLVIQNNNTTQSDIWFDQAVASSYLWLQAGAERMRIDSSGNLMLGTTSVYGGGAQDAKFTMVGGAPSADAARGNMILMDTNAYNASPLFSVMLGGQFNSSNSTTFFGGIGAGKENATDNDYAGFLSLYTRANGGGRSEAIRIDSAGKIGIGTSAPTSKLHLTSGGSNAYSSTITRGSNMVGIVNTISSNADEMVGIYFATGSAIGTHWSGITGSRTDNTAHWGTQLNFYTHDENTSNLNDATQKMVIKGSGNVGINTTNPTQKLEIDGNIKLTSGGYIYGDGANADLHLSNNGGSMLRYGSVYVKALAASVKIIATSEEISLQNNAGTIWMNASGNVGIGTTNPTSKLYVDGNANFTSTISATKGIFSDSSGVGAVLEAYNTVATNATTAIIRQTTAGGNGNQDIGLLVDIQGAADTDRIANFRYYDGSTYTSRMAITRGGNVGIGTTSPSYKLDVATGDDNAIRITNSLGSNTNGLALAVGSGTPWFDFNGASFNIKYNTSPGSWNSGANSHLTILSGGNVGIGTTSPSYKLQVNGSIWARPTSDGTSGTAIHMGRFTDIDTPAYSFITDDYNGDTLYLYSQRWGIDYKIQRASSSGTKEVFRVNGEDTNGHFANLYDASNTVAIQLSSNGNSYLNGGNVGIGTTSPTAKLHVFGGLTKLRAASSGQYDLIRLEDNVGSAYGAIGVNSSGFMYLSNTTSGSQYFVLTTGGNVGIGTTSPDSKFHVEDTNPEVRITGTGGTSFPRLLWEYPVSATQASRWALTASASGNTFYLYNYTQSKKIFQVDGTASHITLNHDAAGTTQIGTSTTQTAYQLYVKTNVGQTGAIEASGAVKITSGALGVNIAASATAGRIDASNDIVAYSTSDERLKENIKPLENATEKVKQLTGVEFDWKEEHKAVHGYEGHDVGVIAQEVQEVLPEAIRTNDSGYLSVRYEKLIALLVESNKELAARVELLEQKLKQ